MIIMLYSLWTQAAHVRPKAKRTLIKHNFYQVDWIYVED